MTIPVPAWIGLLGLFLAAIAIGLASGYLIGLAYSWTNFPRRTFGPDLAARRKRWWEL